MNTLYNWIRETWILLTFIVLAIILGAAALLWLLAPKAV